MFFFFFQAEDGIRDWSVTGVQTCALPISKHLAGREDAGTPRLRGLVPLDGAGALGADVAEHAQVDRSEERRVGKECRCRWSAERQQTKRETREESERC